ncbi:autotransporter assembly complex protein TamA [Roseovarius aestuariivivens]|uniref:autotransporter assembly complex protein TamA n=1 Tax=Roseovarius aestuariivivens TaxID=1888910 RepID=UPI001FD89BE6|nr:BamA/TamA family outer membrane protein [Roseovarius aestuariivivens]
MFSRFLCLLALILAPVSLSATEVAVSVPGAREELSDRLRSASLVVEAAEKDGATAQDVLAAARADYLRMIEVLYDEGHYGGVVSILVDGREAADISPLAGPLEIRSVQVRVQPGPLFWFSRAEIGPLVPNTRPAEGYAAGEAARAGVIRNAAREAVDTWRDVGHAKAEVSDQTITANHAKTAISSQISLSPGPRLRFGALYMDETQSRVRPGRVRAIAGLPTGEIYSPAELQEAEQRLRRTGAFRSVTLREAEVPTADNRLDFNAELTDAKRRRVGAGIELSSLEGLTLSGFWLHRNLLGGAERLRFDFEIGGIGGDSGGIDYKLSGRYERPATFTPNTTLFLGFTIQELDEPEYRERSGRIGGGLTHRVDEDLTVESGIMYQYSEIDDDLGSRTLEHLLFPSSLTFDDRDDELNATKGIYLNIEATPFIGLDNDALGTRLYTDARTYVGLGEDNRFVLAGRFQLGSVAGARATEVPPDMLFYSGGAGTVRGQPYQSLAIDIGNGNRIGGRSFLALSGEVRTKINEKWSIVGFADTGFVGQDSWGTGNGDWHSGAGFGARYNTGIGPIRVDLATPLDDDAGQDFELYIGIGQAF